MFNSPFGNLSSQEINIPAGTEIIFVSDMFIEDYIGGAELTSEALIESSPLSIFKLHSRDVDARLLEQGHQLHWIFGNFSGMNSELIPTIVANMSYSILEYDYKYCRYRSIERHQSIENEPCNCNNEMNGKLVSAFYYGAKSLWWMSERQQELYHKLFPFLEERANVVLSSVFDEKFFLTLKILRERYAGKERKGWLTLGSTSWIKGAEAAENWCKEQGHEYEVLWNIPYEVVLEKLAQAEGFVYLPQGGDTCPRMVIEAKLLGCKLHVNEDVQHKDELWFASDNLFDTESYLYAARERFWTGIKYAMEWSPNLSGYITTLNCIKHRYPWRESIKSLLGFCNEVVVVDGGSEDGTWEELEKWASDQEDGRLKVHKVERDWDDPRFAVFDGAQKAEARERCIGDFCWQQDADEIVHEGDYQKVRDFLKTFPNNADLVSLPVIEYWGRTGKVRVDVNPWKWRLSRNKDYITHGIPKDLRQHDEAGNLYAATGTDGCDYVHKDTHERIPHASFYTNQVHVARGNALHGNEKAVTAYEEWYQRTVEMLPGVHHYSWFDLARKIKTYRDYWSQHWQSLYDITQEDTSENNMFFQRPWADITDDDIEELATNLEEKLGGWIFHTPVDFSTPTPHVKLDRDHPEVMKEFLDS